MMHPPASLSLSKGESRTFLLQEVLSYVFMAAVMIGGFKYYGLVGLGVGMLLTNLFDWLTVWLIAKLRYQFAYSRQVWRLLIAQCPILVAMLLVCIYTHGWSYACRGAVVMLCSVAYSFHFLHRNTTITHRLLAKIRAKVPTATKEKKS
jgi:hypothetical protein